MVVITGRGHHRLVPDGVTFRDRLWARLRARALDAALAAGADPTSTTRLGLRAAAITTPVTRRQLARALERVLAEATRPPGLRPTPLTPCRRRVVARTAVDLTALITRLRDPGPVVARGAAEVIALLSDGAGPLHLGTAEPDLRTAVRQALGHLDGPTAAGGAGGTGGAQEPGSLRGALDPRPRLMPGGIVAAAQNRQSSPGGKSDGPSGLFGSGRVSAPGSLVPQAEPCRRSVDVARAGAAGRDHPGGAGPGVG